MRRLNRIASLATGAILIAGGLARAAESVERTADPAPTELTAEQVARGHVLQRLLARGIDYSRENKRWPKDLSELKIESLPAITYLWPSNKLDDVTQLTRAQLNAVLAVCHESFEKYPDGVWVGFADGHLELARDANTLKTALGQFELAKPGIEKNGQIPEGSTPASVQPDTTVLVRLVDEDGKPVAGAKIGTYLSKADFDTAEGRGGLYTKLGDKVSDQEATSDEAGQVRAQYQWLFQPEVPRAEALMAMHSDRGLIGIEKIEPKLFVADENGSKKELTVTLRRGVPIRGSLSRIGASQKSKDGGWSNAYIWLLGGGSVRPMLSMSQHSTFNFLLPPGEYLVQPYGNNTYNTFRYLRVTNDMQSCDLYVDLPVTRLGGMEGKPAAELRGIKEWKNGDATTLEKLRGKWVLLDFWGYWCGPCIGAMPDLMKLHDDFGDKGLAIIAVHDDSVSSIKEMDKNLAEIKKERWKGRDLPFFVALDGGGEQPISGTQRNVKGATHAEYGIQRWPTSVLIDPQGNVVGDMSVTSPDLRKLLEKKLGGAK